MTQRKSRNSGFFANLWNEFLFAREFDYETPLTPDEMADALRTLDGENYRSWMLDSGNLTHGVNYTPDGDKAGTFKIEIESSHRGKWWSTNSAMIYSEGEMTANPDTGMTRITGRTRFDGNYYSTFLFLFFVNFVTQALQQEIFWQVMWLIFIVVFWYAMYRSRNTLSDRLDTVIMNAKSDRSTVHLVDTAEEYGQIDDEQQQEGYIVG